MRWFRSHIRAGSRLALLALAVQFFVTFGHVHLDGLINGSTSAAKTIGHATASLHNPADGGQQAPGTVDDDCPICSLIQLASASAPSVAPPLPTPTLRGGLKLVAPDDRGQAASLRLAFLARGPPSI
ncbi:MAG TPA: DUF2946 family protein [Xanthobacteraceae bacterium]|nr:DUF2946 family protein [Xanthobacteraceae bacterium]